MTAVCAGPATAGNPAGAVSSLPAGVGVGVAGL